MADGNRGFRGYLGIRKSPRTNPTSRSPSSPVRPTRQGLMRRIANLFAQRVPDSVSPVTPRYPTIQERMLRAQQRRFEENANVPDARADSKLLLGSVFAVLEELVSKHDNEAALRLLDRMSTSAIADTQLPCSRRAFKRRLTAIFGQHTDVGSLLSVMEAYEPSSQQEGRRGVTSGQQGSTNPSPERRGAHTMPRNARLSRVSADFAPDPVVPAESRRAAANDEMSDSGTDELSDNGSVADLEEEFRREAAARFWRLAFTVHTRAEAARRSTRHHRLSVSLGPDHRVGEPARRTNGVPPEESDSEAVCARFGPSAPGECWPGALHD